MMPKQGISIESQQNGSPTANTNMPFTYTGAGGRPVPELRYQYVADTSTGTAYSTVLNIPYGTTSSLSGTLALKEGIPYLHHGLFS